MRLIVSIFFILFALVGRSQIKQVNFDDHTRRTSIYPNPARSFLQIQYKPSSELPSVLVVYNFLGKKQLEISKPTSNVYVDLSEFRRGIYIFQFRDSNGRIIDSGKFQVEK